MICFTFMVLEKHQNSAVPVRNVGYSVRMRGISLLFAIIALLALAGYVVRGSNKMASNTLLVLSGLLLVLLVLGLTRVV